MRRSGVVGIVALLGFCVSPQVASAEQWANRYFDPADGDRIPSCVRALPGGGYIVAGQAIDTKKNVSSGWLMKLDSSGSKLWARTYSNDTQGRPSSAFTWVEQTSGGGFIACGWAHSSTTDGRDGQGWIARLDPSGGKLWSWVFEGNGTGQLRRVRIADDGSYIGVGHYSATVSVVGTDGWAVRISHSGNLLWSATYGDAANDELWDVQKTSDGGYVAVGSLTQAFGGNTVGWALGLGRSGKIRWQKTYEGTDNRGFRAIGAQSDEGFVVAGQINPSDFVSTVWLLKMSPAGDLNWQLAYRPVNAFRLDFSAMEQAPDGGILVAGEKIGGLVIKEERVALGVRSDGMVEWTNSMGSPWLQSLSALDLSDDGIVYAGAVKGYHGDAMDCLVLTTTRSGEACQDVGSMLNTVRSSTASLVGDSSVKRETPETRLRSLSPGMLQDGIMQRSYCALPSLTQDLVLSRSPQSDGVTVKYVCTNSGRVTVPFKAQVFFSKENSYPFPAAPLMVLEVQFSEGLGSESPSGPYYSINAKGDYRYAIAVIDPEGQVSEIKDDPKVRIEALP